DLVRVVERGAADGRAGDEHRLEGSGGSEGARPADVDVDGDDASGRLLRRELVRDRPARMVGRRPEPPLLDKAIHLHDRAVRVVAEAVALRLELLAVAPDVVEGRARLAARIGREPALLEG